MSKVEIVPLSDQAVTLSFGNVISEANNNKVLAIKNWFEQRALPGILDVVVAYSSITVIYDVAEVKSHAALSTCVDFISALLKQAAESVEDVPARKSVSRRIPVCYDADFGPDLASVCQLTGLSREELINIHSSGTYKVYMIGFLPGFPYMGETDMRLHVSRRPSPRPFVEPGSVGLAGRQTGIYPFRSPGGWQIIGRTPIALFDKSSASVSLLNAGDFIQFYAVTREEFWALQQNAL